MCASSSVPHSLNRHDVYISYRSEDTRLTFTSHLHNALVRARIKTFADDADMEVGDSIGSLLEEGIQQSNISLIIFSENYASSKSCLDELVHILQCRETNRQIVLPVFYNVDPSQVRKQTQSYGAALARHNTRFMNDEHKLCAWRAALKEAANLCGWDSRNTRSESLLVKEIVQDILKKRIQTNLNISINSLAYNLCHEYLSLFLQLGAGDVLVVGIAGESKMGKTVMAKAIFDGISQAFDGGSFIRGVGQKSRKSNGLIQLQKQLVFNLLQEDIKITSLTRGMAAIKERLCQKRVLIVLDDVDDLEQLFALVGSRYWFGLGSKIIITTRMLPMLQDFGVDQIFMAQGNPLPLDIQEIWEPYQQSCSKITGLKEYIQSFSYLTDEKVKYLEECLIKERRKGSIQAQMIHELKHGQGEESASTCAIPEIGSSLRVCEADAGALDSMAADRQLMVDDCLMKVHDLTCTFADLHISHCKSET